MGCEDRAAGRAGFKQAYRKFDGAFNADDAAARMDHEDRATRAFFGQAPDKAVQVGRHQRLDESVGADGVETLELAHLRRNFRGDRNRNVCLLGEKPVSHDLLVRAVQIRVDEADGDALIAGSDDVIAQGIDFIEIKRLQHETIGADTFIDDKPFVARHERRRQNDIKIILFETAFGAHFDDVAKALGGDEGGACTPPFDQRIGGKRRAVNDRVDFGKLDTGDFGDLPDALDDRIFGIGIVGQHFDRMERDAYLHRNVGEGATDIDTDPDLLAIFRHCLSHAP
ncbi:hypothetical protein D3C71_757250 [compost metagenome]